MILYNDPLIAEFDSGFDQETIDWLLSFNDYDKSKGFDFLNPSSALTRHRTSLTRFENNGEFKEIRQKMLDRISEVCGKPHPLVNAEYLQLTRYQVGQEYRPHWDHFNIPGNETFTENDRIATALLYLNDGFAGGETVFTSLNISVTPVQGNILYFEYPQDKADFLKHAGMPVTQGEKRIVSLWIRQNRWNFQD